MRFINVRNSCAIDADVRFIKVRNGCAVDADVRFIKVRNGCAVDADVRFIKVRNGCAVDADVRFIKVMTAFMALSVLVAIQPSRFDSELGRRTAAAASATRPPQWRPRERRKSRRRRHAGWTLKQECKRPAIIDVIAGSEVAPIFGVGEARMKIPHFGPCGGIAPPRDVAAPVTFGQPENMQLATMPPPPGPGIFGTAPLRDDVVTISGDQSNRDRSTTMMQKMSPPPGPDSHGAALRCDDAMPIALGPSENNQLPMASPIGPGANDTALPPYDYASATVGPPNNDPTTMSLDDSADDSDHNPRFPTHATGLGAPPGPWDELIARTPVDDFANEPGYREFVSKCGRCEAFEEARARCIKRGVVPWTMDQFKLATNLDSERWLENDPSVLVPVLKSLLAAAVKAGGDDSQSFDGSVTTIREFLARDCSAVYLVEDLLPKDQLCIVGGPEKGQKSNLLNDLIISLSSGTPWLGHFSVPQRRKVLFLTGETQGANLQNIIRRVLEARNLTADDLGDRLVIKEVLPILDQQDNIATLQHIITRERIEVVILDPLYFALGEIDSHLLTQVGGTIAGLAKTCIAAGATPILAHHMSKTAQMRRGEEREPIQLADLNGAGFGPVAGSWILVNYLIPYDSETGACTLWLNVGGRSGHGGLYTIRIDEGPFVKNTPLNGRGWNVRVEAGHKAIETAQRIKLGEKAASDDAKKKAKAEIDEKLMQDIRQFLIERAPIGAIQSEISAQFGQQPKKVGTLLSAMRSRNWATRAELQMGDNSNAHRWVAVVAS